MSVIPEPRSVLIIGQGPSALACSHTLIDYGRGRYRLGAVVPPEELQQFLAAARFSEPAQAVSVPETWVVALEDRRTTLPVDQLLDARFQGVRVQSAAEFMEELTGKIPVRSVRAGDLVFSTGYGILRSRLIVKTVVERIAALILLVLMLPLGLLAALAIVLESGRPIFFRQTRVGRGGRLFQLIKLRTMRPDAERHGPRFAEVDDVRATKVGRILRRTRIDELPQLLNVLRGEMTLIGPRPERPEFVAQYSELIPFFRLRHSIRPGITGWAQVNEGYTRDSDGALEKLCYDLYYLKHHALLFDAWIAVLTVVAIVRGEGA